MNLSESSQSFHHFLSLKHDLKKMREKSQVKKVDLPFNSQDLI